MTERVSWLRAAAVALALSAPCIAQENPYEPLPPLPIGSVLLSLPSPHVTPAATWEVGFAHRFLQPVDSGNHSLWGLDGGANVTFGLAWVPVHDLQLSVTRSNILDDIELAGKYVVMQQAPAIPVSLSLRAGADFRTEENVDDRTSVFAQLLVSRQLGSRFEIFVVPTVVTNAGRASAGDRSVALFSHAFNAPVAVAYQLMPTLSVVGEFVPANRDLPRSVDREHGWAVGIKRVVGGHHFEILLTNTTATTVDEYTTTTALGAPLRRGDVHLGFNIERQFGGK